MSENIETQEHILYKMLDLDPKCDQNEIVVLKRKNNTEN